MVDRIRVALADYPITASVKAKAGDLFEFDPIKPVTKAFKPMIRNGAYDISEMAIVTYVQARAYNKPIWLLPVALLARFQHKTIVCNSQYSTLRPKDLEGKTVGARSYSQTTVMWARTILASEYDVDIDKIDWVTFEDGHVAEYSDPENARRAPAGSSVAAMLQAGDIDAAILGNDLPKDDARLITVIEDPKGDAKRGYEKNRVVPINHMVVASQDLIERRPEVVKQFFDMLAASKAAGNGVTEAGVDMNPIGIDALRHSLETIIEHCFRQKLIDRRLTVDELFHDKTRDMML
ncbi:phosphate/phosphite/phosphonate ABC transporter substrate-binding protein [Rhizobium sp. 1AS11]|uniref:phosphate/phosphite/phosphonate ABC transporter substrate-binding protein n=1 Tax=Rhizobium acaciae TaxID=2989736 RepID=UPI0022235BC0|nr:phosphate/phosphite/phosphonate ABC transporter substrate-binding protein [Rhizobium acaciae]MCW1411304.1 phosphate/phosphite/phosphonate ABC transporter substrate-binding protein [Rhizobium acaciae]MCW1743284.1 phosphate/phosphite/phosphonate ABC transporter substrate-binding protein [Rhizobium acaciae]